MSYQQNSYRETLKKLLSAACKMLPANARVRTVITAATVVMAAMFAFSTAWATAASTTTVLTVTSAGSGATSVAAGTVVTLTAMVTTGNAHGTAVTPGLVEFCDAAAAYCEDMALLGTAQLTAAGIATYKFIPDVGIHSYKAIFSGTSTYTESTSSAVALTVTPTHLFATSTSVVPSGQIGDYTLTATVTGKSSRIASFTGDVSFLDTTNSTTLGTAAPGATVQTENFTSSVIANASSGPSYAATGDFNGDGITDLAVVNGSGFLNILLGNGDGTFTIKSSPNVGALPSGAVVADFNSDGISDLAVANRADSTVTVLLGQGDGTFVPQSTIGVGSHPSSIVAADFNRDGIPDLAVTNAGDGTVTVLLGSGNGSFTTKSTLSVGNLPNDVVVGDFNGDGNPDLVTLNYNDNTITILLGNGDGTFTTKATPASGTGPGYAATGDFNGDGITDLAVVDVEINTVMILLGNGDGTFTPKSTAVTGISPGLIFLGDFNGDGIADLAVANVGDGTITILSGHGDGTFTTASTMAAAAYLVSIVAGDLNEDGLTDLAALSAGANPVTVMLNQIVETATASINNISIASGGAHLVDASYAGDSVYSPSTSSTVSLLSSKIATTLQLASSTNSSSFGYQVTLTATLSPYASGNFTTGGDSVTFYSGGASIGTATLSSGVAMLTLTSLPIGSNTLTAVYGGDNYFTGSTSNAITEQVNPATVPGFVVTVNTDDASGVPSNCTGIGSTNCSLRDALAAAAAAGKGNITFSAAVFAPSQPASALTITLTGNSFTIPSNTAITGLTSGSGSSSATPVTISGGVTQNTVFMVNAGATNVSISNLSITGEVTSGPGGAVYNDGALTLNSVSMTGFSIDSAGGGIFNDQAGTLTLINCSIQNNFALLGSSVGAGVYNGGTMKMTASSVSNNGTRGASGVGIYNDTKGMLIIESSSISGNVLYDGGFGGGIANYGNLNLTSSTVASNQAPYVGNGSGIYNHGTMTMTNSIISDNATNNGDPSQHYPPPVEDDCDGSGCPVNGASGNVVGAGLASNFPGNSAVCAGVVSDIPAGLTIDQRGLPRTTTYGTTVCTDAGAIQSHYALSFTQEPPPTVGVGMAFPAAVQINESGRPLLAIGIAVPLTLGAGDNGTLSGNTGSTNSIGVASFNQLQVSAPGVGDMLVATLPLTSSPPPPALTSPVSISAISSPFNVVIATQTITFPALASPVTYGVAPMALKATASSGLAVSYSVTGPAAISSSILTITGAGTVTVTASQAGNTDYTAAAPVVQTILVNKAVTNTTLKSSVSNASVNSPITLTATITSSAGVPGGSVQFSDGATILDTVAVNAQGIATYTTSTLAPGSHSIKATYSGNQNFTESQATLTQTVAEATQTITFPALVSPVSYGVAPMALKATASSGLTVSYSVTGPATINASMLTITGAGPVTVTASQTGNVDYTAAAPVAQTITVNKAISTTTLTSSASDADLNTSITLTATVASSVGIPSGSVQFSDGTTVLGTSAVNAQGVAAYTISTLAAGSHSIGAVYSGDQNFTGSQATLTQTVSTPGFSLSANPTSLTLKQGQSGQVKITLTPENGYKGSLTFACTGLPALAYCNFNPSTLMANGSDSPVSIIATIATSGSNGGMASLRKPNEPLSGTSAVLLCWLPGGVLGFVLVWQRKRLSSATKRIMWIVLFIAGGTGLIACGTPPSTPAGASSITITASGAGSSQSVTLNVTIIK
jgi:hypothetical protein